MSITVTLNNETGPKKLEIVEAAYGLCGQAADEFGVTVEELQTGLRRLNAVMRVLATKGYNLGFNFPSYGVGELEEFSGIPDDALDGVAALLAIRIAPGLGHTLTPTAAAAIQADIRDLYTNHATMPTMPLAADTPRGAGSRRWRYNPFINETADDVNPTDEA